jgi:AraC-like DNA-binding protein
MEGPRVTVARHEDERGWMELISGEAAPVLRRHVGAYWGYAEESAGPVRRRECPHGELIFVLSFGPKLRIRYSHDASPQTRTSFVAGLHETSVVTEHDGSALGVEFTLSPLAARRLLGVPLNELLNRAVPLEDVLLRANELVERLEEASSWSARFAILDRELLARLGETEDASLAMQWAWGRLRTSAGRQPIGELAQELGWSRKRLTAQFRDDVGMTPKAVARVLRFERAVQLLQNPNGHRLAEIAFDCGYYDQAHFNRDFREFAGGTPTEFLARSANGFGVAA